MLIYEDEKYNLKNEVYWIFHIYLSIYIFTYVLTFRFHWFISYSSIYLFWFISGPSDLFSI